MPNNIIPLVWVKCIDGKMRLKGLKNIYCKHYKFSRDNMDAGCCFGSAKYSNCGYKNPRNCERFELKRGFRYANEK